MGRKRTFAASDDKPGQPLRLASCSSSSGRAAPAALAALIDFEKVAFAEEFARELWEAAGESWDDAPEYRPDAYRRRGRLAAEILRRRGLLG
jgi:hypothetical protein